MSNQAQIVPRHGQLGTEACLLVEALKGGKQGDIMTDEELMKICGRDCRNGNGAGPLRSAIYHVTTAYGVRWKRIPGEGCIKVLNASERAALTGSTIKSIGRKARRAVQEASTIRISELSETERNSLIVNKAILGLQELAAKPVTAKELGQKQVADTPNVKKLLELFD